MLIKGINHVMISFLNMQSSKRQVLIALFVPLAALELLVSKDSSGPNNSARYDFNLEGHKFNQKALGYSHSVPATIALMGFLVKAVVIVTCRVQIWVGLLITLLLWQCADRLSELGRLVSGDETSMSVLTSFPHVLCGILWSSSGRLTKIAITFNVLGVQNPLTNISVLFTIFFQQQYMVIDRETYNWSMRRE